MVREADAEVRVELCLVLRIGVRQHIDDVGASVVLALLSAVGASTIGYDASAIQVVAGVGVLLDSVWILLISIFLWRHPALPVP